jgi:hypothetical protein
MNTVIIIIIIIIAIITIAITVLDVMDLTWKDINFRLQKRLLVFH